MKKIFLSFFIFCLSISSFSQMKCLIGDCTNAYGIAQQQNGSYRQGFFVDSRPTGYEMVMAKGYILVGFYASDSNTLSRFGMYKKGNDIIISNNTKHYGIEFNPSKRIFNKVHFTDDNLTVTSRTALKNNNLSTGCIFGDCENGFGVYVYDSSSYAVGEWQNGKKNGIVYLNNNKGTYYGEYVNGAREGYGTYRWTKQRSYYSGQWKAGNMEGKGVYHLDNKRFRAGYYSSGKLTRVINTSQEEKNNSTVTTNNSTKKPEEKGNIMQQLANRINNCNKDVRCLAKIYNTMAEITSGMSKKETGEKIMSGILAMMNAHKKGVLFDVFVAAGTKYSNHFLDSAKHLPLEVRKEMARKSDEFVKNNQ